MIDLRDTSDEIIEESLQKYYFLNPNNCGKNIFLIINSAVYSDLIQNDSAEQKIGFNEIWIPNVEVWLPAPITLNKVSYVIEVQIERKPVLWEYRPSIKASNFSDK